MPEGSAPQLPGVNGETVEAVLDQLRALIATEDSREQGFNARAGGLTGFGAVIVAVTTALANEIFGGDIRGVWLVLAIAFWGLALGCFGVTLFVSVARVLMPQGSSAIGMAGIRKYGTYEVVGQPRSKFQGDTILGLIEVLALDRERNSSKAQWLRHAYVWLLIGLATLVLAGAMVGVGELQA
jgi:hypothetical protein